MSKEKLEPPAHLRSTTGLWWQDVHKGYELEPHHVRLLTLACESWDRGVAAREAITKHGAVFTDRFGQPRARPEIGIERDSRVAFARLIRELGLDLDDPHESRPHRVHGTAKRRR